MVQLSVSVVLVRESPPCSGSRRWRYLVARTIHNSKIFHKGGREVKTHSCAREADPALPAPHESPRPSQRVAIYLLAPHESIERYEGEVDSRSATAHLLLVATNFRCSCSPPRVATTYHDALKVSQSTVLFVSPLCPLAIADIAGVDRSYLESE